MIYILSCVFASCGGFDAIGKFMFTLSKSKCISDIILRKLLGKFSEFFMLNAWKNFAFAYCERTPSIVGVVPCERPFM